MPAIGVLRSRGTFPSSDCYRQKRVIVSTAAAMQLLRCRVSWQQSIPPPFHCEAPRSGYVPLEHPEAMGKDRGPCLRVGKVEAVRTRLDPEDSRSRRAPPQAVKSSV